MPDDKPAIGRMTIPVPKRIISRYDWAGIDSEIARHIADRTRQCLAAYKANPILVTEHANIERATAQGGYGRRQIYELVQNGADALLGEAGGRIHVVLTDSALYCGNEGEPIDTDGIDAILSSHISMKRGKEIGRFGLGFKSVLGVTGRPEFYSSSGSFRFSASESEQKIRKIVPHAERFPTLRIAFPINGRKSAGTDPVLAELMRWSTTVVKLPRDLMSAAWLSEDLANFPAEFLLFSPHVGSLILEDRVKSWKREIRLSKKGKGISLEEDGTASMWQVFATDYVPTDDARKDAGELSDRESLPIMWAVPLKGKAAAARGRFWAFFPTDYLTTLSGIVNAPWKTNEDRQNLLTGVFNEEIIAAASQLIAGSLASLESDDDPGRFLDLMPARGREAPNWADELITEKVYAYAATLPVLPDQFETRRTVSDLQLHPGSLPSEALQAWSAFEHRPTNWCHHSVDNAQRRSRVERIFALTGRLPASLGTWLEALAADRSPEGSLAAIKTAAAIVSSPTMSSYQRTQVEGSRIVLSREGVLRHPRPGTIFIASDLETPSLEVDIVHDYLSNSEDGRAALSVLGITEVDASSELEARLASGCLVLTDSQWRSFWELVGRVPTDRAIELCCAYAKKWSEYCSLHVGTVSGQFRPIWETLLPGEIVPSDGSRDTQVAIDLTLHSRVVPVLAALGAVRTPTLRPVLTGNRWFKQFRRTAIGVLPSLTRLGGGKSTPQEAHLIFDQKSALQPLDPLFELSDEGRVRFTERLLLNTEDDKPWILFHNTRPDSYPKVTMDSPELWMARREGRLRTSLGLRPVSEAVGTGLRAWARLFPVAECGEAASRRLKLPDTLSGLTPAHWAAALKAAESLEDDRLLGRFYPVSAEYVVRPARIRCRRGDEYVTRSPRSIAAVWKPNEVRALTQSAMPFLPVASQEDVECLVERWGMLRSEAVVTISVYHAPSGSETPLIDRFPGIERYLGEDRIPLYLIPCSSVRLDTITGEGKKGEERTCVHEGSRIYFIDTLDNASLLNEIDRELELRLPADRRAAILEQRELNERRNLVVSIRMKPDLSEKLLAAVGVEAIRRHLPRALLTAAEEEYGKLSDLRLAQLSMAVYGVEALHEFREDLHRTKLSPPQMWAGSYNARKFVHELGFPKEYAGFQEARRDAVLEVDGPPNLPPLHDFQEAIVARIHRLLDGKDETRRALLSLPTGAGKTRVAVESLVRAIAEKDLGGPILWVAQTDELCEQAVQTWSEVWRGLGPRSRLHINRLWASNEADSYGNSPQVVVATDAKLTTACMGNPAYEWLQEASCVVIDEAHISTQPSYTAILEWVGLRRGADRCPLIGLTATPFKGGEDQTRFLAGRYGRNRLDAGVLGEDPYKQLQDMGVLAQVDHMLLKGSTLQLSEKELADLSSLHALSSSVYDRIGSDVSRNQVLLRSIKNLPDGWPVLLFAASVDHARAMAALLSAEGIAAAAISSATDAGARRHYVEQFRRGKIRVLANYAVLTAGFDAPSIRALYVGRPTYSPVLYQQMIGRGLRGPLNGGKERCLIVNVEDNILQYGEKLAFTQFEYLWRRE